MASVRAIVSDSYSRWDIIRTLKNYKLKNVLECGCGLGYFTKSMHDYCPDSNITGMDISENAISQAKKLFPGISFQVGNVNQLGTTIDIGKFDGIIFAEIMFYILDDLQSVMSMLKAKYHGTLIINQIFYRGRQKYGREFFTTEKEMFSFIGLNPIVQNRYEVDSNVISYETHNVFQINF